MTDFLGTLWSRNPSQLPLYGELRLIRNGVVRQKWQTLVHGDDYSFLDFPEDSAGWDVFFGVLPRHQDDGSAASCVKETYVLWADVDAKAHGGEKLAAFLALGQARLAPSILVDSGNGLHCYWLLGDPVPFQQAQAAMKGLAKAIGGDHVYDAARILRLPGTHNHKSDPPKPVRLLVFKPAQTYRFSDFSDYIEVEEPSGYDHDWGEGDGKWAPSSSEAPRFPEGSRNRELTRLAGIMVVKGLSSMAIRAALVIENQIRCVPPLPEQEVFAIARSVERYR
jgi:hypothetical protein